MEKSISFYGSFVLITNNVIGPPMMALPHLVQKCGIIPVVVMLIVVCLCSSISSTLLAESISSIPGNRDFSRAVEYSTGYQYIVGKKWFGVVEILFLMSCLVQACAAIVETSQSIDQFFASFVFGSSFALQISPTIEFVSWEPSLCQKSSSLDDDDSSNLLNCLPFHDSGPLILSIGFLVTAVLFLPFGLHNFKESMFIQYISFGFLFFLLAQFYIEFSSKNLEFSFTVPYFGDNFNQLAGVVLFNYAFAITIPSWLNEKQSDVSVNKVVWLSTIMSTIIYISFALFAAFSFTESSPNILTLLASKKVSTLTRLCSLLFGVFIIGAGIPTFLIMMRTSLQHGGVCSSNVSLFLGAYLPFCISWMLYQGDLLLHVLNWAGLIVNSLVAFILPLLLTLRAIQKVTENYSIRTNTSSIPEIELNTYHVINENSDLPEDIIYHVDEEVDVWEKQKSCGCGDASYYDVNENHPLMNTPRERQKTYNNTSNDSNGNSPYLSENNDALIQPTFSTTLSSLFSSIWELVSSNTRIKYLYLREAILPLPQFISLKFKSIIVQSILLIFLSIIVFNFYICRYYNVPIDEEDGEDNFRETSISSYVYGGFR